MQRERHIPSSEIETEFSRLATMTSRRPGAIKLIHGCKRREAIGFYGSALQISFIHPTAGKLLNII